LKLPKEAIRGTYKRLLDRRLGMVTARWRYSKDLQTVSTVMKKGSSNIKRRIGSNIIEVDCPNDIILYQKNMGGVDRGDQHRTVGAGFANVSHFKKWYKKTFLAIADFSLLNAFTAWNLSVDQITDIRRGNSEVKRKKLIKWEFYSVLAEELMAYVDINDDRDENSEMSSFIRTRKNSMRGHVPAPYFSFDRTETANRPVCMICSMEEMAKAQVLKLPRNKTKNRKMARRTKYLVKCMHDNCHIVAHATCPNESKVSEIPYFSGLTCFEIAHHPKCQDLFTKIKRKGQHYCRTIPSHPVVQDTKELYQSELPRRSNREHSRPGRPPTVINRSQTVVPVTVTQQIVVPSTSIRSRRPPTVIQTIASPTELDNITAITGPGTGDLISAKETPEDTRKPDRSLNMLTKRKRQQQHPTPLVRRSLRSTINKKQVTTRSTRKSARYKIARM